MKITKTSKFKKKVGQLMIMVGTLTMFTIPVAASGTAQAAQVKTVFEKIYADVALIFNPACVVALGICMVLIMVSKNNRHVEEAMGWRNNIIKAWVIFNCLGLMINYGQTLLQGFSWK